MIVPVEPRTSTTKDGQTPTLTILHVQSRATDSVMSGSNSPDIIPAFHNLAPLDNCRSPLPAKLGSSLN